jgi:3-(3-hydroxy-phenyl)propionate hydroxylase
VLEDIHGLVAQRYDARPGTLYLIRPDQHVCARWRSVDTAKLAAAVRRATGHSVPATTPRAAATA